MALSLSQRMDIVEQKVAALEALPARVSALELAVSDLRTEMQAEFSAVRQEMVSMEQNLRTEIRTGDEETRRFMRVLHEDVIHRITLLGERR